MSALDGKRQISERDLKIKGPSEQPPGPFLACLQQAKDGVIDRGHCTASDRRCASLLVMPPKLSHE
jgi:hypothetical protein